MIAVIGDIHGCYYTLLDLVALLKEKYGDIALYTTGDLIDRGNFPHLVINYCSQNNTGCVKGNHDAMFADVILNAGRLYYTTWLFADSTKTEQVYRTMKSTATEHARYLDELPYCQFVENTLITHAGVSLFYKNIFVEWQLWNPDEWNSALSVTAHQPTGVLWNTGRLLNLGFTQVIGHKKQVEIKHFSDSDTYNVDTGVYTGNYLSAVVIKEGKLFDKLSVKTLAIDYSDEDE